MKIKRSTYDKIKWFGIGNIVTTSIIVVSVAAKNYKIFRAPFSKKPSYPSYNSPQNRKSS
jgi:hypothetical protein